MLATLRLWPGQLHGAVACGCCRHLLPPSALVVLAAQVCALHDDPQLARFGFVVKINLGLFQYPGLYALMVLT